MGLHILLIFLLPGCVTITAGVDFQYQFSAPRHNHQSNFQIHRLINADVRLAPP